MHATAGIDRRALGVDEQVGRLLHMNGIRAVAGAQHRRVVQRLRHLLVPHVRRDLDDHRAAAAVLQLGKGAAKNVGDFRGGMIGSDDFENAFIASLELKFGSICASLR